MSDSNALSSVRVPWNGFPEVLAHSSIYRLKGLPEYEDAKTGDHKAALRIAKTLIHPKRFNICADFVIPIIQVDSGHYNAIPVAFAALLAKATGAKVWLDVCQINKVNHTKANGFNRLQSQPIFGGSAPKGSCVVCDDVVTFGASLANLRGFLTNAGTQVLAATVIGAAYGSTKLAPTRTLIRSLQRRYGEELEKYTSSLGFNSDCLTGREGYFLAGIRTIDRIRDCFTQEIGKGDCRRGIVCQM